MKLWYVIEGLVRETLGQARKACRRYGYDPAHIVCVRGTLADALKVTEL